MTQPAVEQLLNLTNRAQHHGGLTHDEAQRLCDGINTLQVKLAAVREDRDRWREQSETWRTEARTATERAERAEAVLAQAQRDQLTDREAIAYWTQQAEQARTERATVEAATERVRALAVETDAYGYSSGWVLTVANVRAALDPQEPQPGADTKEH